MCGLCYIDNRMKGTTRTVVSFSPVQGTPTPIPHTPYVYFLIIQIINYIILIALVIPFPLIRIIGNIIPVPLHIIPY